MGHGGNCKRGQATSLTPALRRRFKTKRKLPRLANRVRHRSGRRAVCDAFLSSLGSMAWWAKPWISGTRFGGLWVAGSWGRLRASWCGYARNRPTACPKTLRSGAVALDLWNTPMRNAVIRIACAAPCNASFRHGGECRSPISCAFGTMRRAAIPAVAGYEC